MEINPRNWAGDIWGGSDWNGLDERGDRVVQPFIKIWRSWVSKAISSISLSILRYVHIDICPWTESELAEHYKLNSPVKRRGTENEYSRGVSVMCLDWIILNNEESLILWCPPFLMISDLHFVICLKLLSRYYTEFRKENI